MFRIVTALFVVVISALPVSADTAQCPVGGSEIALLDEITAAMLAGNYDEMIAIADADGSMSQQSKEQLLDIIETGTGGQQAENCFILQSKKLSDEFAVQVIGFVYDDRFLYMALVVSRLNGNWEMIAMQFEGQVAAILKYLV